MKPRTDSGWAEAAAFSIDDAATTEIDDAFSLQFKPEGGARVGIHIAAPGAGFRPGSALDAIARERLSTAYMPGRKFTMLPEEVIERFSLDAAARAHERLESRERVGALVLVA